MMTATLIIMVILILFLIYAFRLKNSKNEEDERKNINALKVILTITTVGFGIFASAMSGDGVVILFIFYMLLFAFVCDSLGEKKGSSKYGFFWGYFLGILGLIILWALSNNQTNTTVVNNLSNADELKKYKDVLDNGVIIQDEFDQKKKQLLNL